MGRVRGNRGSTSQAKEDLWGPPLFVPERQIAEMAWSIQRPPPEKWGLLNRFFLRLDANSRHLPEEASSPNYEEVQQTIAERLERLLASLRRANPELRSPYTVTIMRHFRFIPEIENAVRERLNLVRAPASRVDDLFVALGKNFYDWAKGHEEQRGELGIMVADDGDLQLRCTLTPPALRPLPD
jgi:hypothetical protein